MLKSTSVFTSVLKFSDHAMFKNNKLFIKVILPKTFTFCHEKKQEILDRQCILRKFFHTSTSTFKKTKSEDKIVLNFTEFEKAEQKNKKTFLENIKLYESNFQHKRGLVDFIKIALRSMKDFGVHKDLEVYKKLADILPKGVFVATNVLLAEMMYYPRQQYVIIELLEQMEENGVVPDRELGEIIKNIFGKLAEPTKKFYRMLYWTTKFKNKSPWLLPKQMPLDSLQLGKMAIERITSVDLQTEISVFKTEDIAESLDYTWIVSGQSPKQKELLKNHLPPAPVIVEGGEIVWLRDKCVSYFVLKADTEPFPFVPPDNIDDLSKMRSMYFNPDFIEEKDNSQSVHEQDNGIIYAVCATGTSSKDSLLSWVRLLQKNGNPILENIPVLFRFKTPEKIPAPFSDAVVNQ